MTPEERNMLTDLANKFAQTPAPPKDQEAEDFIRTKIGSRPDALYIMTQTVLIQNLALQKAQQQLQELQSRVSQPAPAGGGGSFLGQGSSSGPSYSQPGASYSQPGYAPPPPAPAPSSSGTGGFLRGAAQTAAGVAAGALAFEGVESLLHGFGHGGGGFESGFGGFGGPGFGGGGYERPVDETVVNNYYEGSGGGDRDFSGSDRDNFTDSSSQDASYDDTDSPIDDSSFDDNSGGGDNFS